MSRYPKGDRCKRQRTAEPRKRKLEFHGNRLTSVSSDDGDLHTSRSEQKLKTASSDDVIIHSSHCYRIIEFISVFLALSEIAICRSCKQKLTFAESGHRGLGFKIVVMCMCGRREIQSGPLINTGYKINRRIVFVMKLLGIGREGINVFCGLIDMSAGFKKSTYQQIVEHLYAASKTLF